MTESVVLRDDNWPQLALLPLDVTRLRSNPIARQELRGCAAFVAQYDYFMVGDVLVVSLLGLKTAIAIPSNRGVGAWGDVLGETTGAATMLNRPPHRSVVIKSERLQCPLCRRASTSCDARGRISSHPARRPSMKSRSIANTNWRWIVAGSA